MSLTCTAYSKKGIVVRNEVRWGRELLIGEGMKEEEGRISACQEGPFEDVEVTDDVLIVIEHHYVKFSGKLPVVTILHIG